MALTDKERYTIISKMISKFEDMTDERLPDGDGYDHLIMGNILDVVLNDPALDDIARMDWLEKKLVEVRQPLRYGSHHMFFAVNNDEENDEPSDLRSQIDEAIRNNE